RSAITIGSPACRTARARSISSPTPRGTRAAGSYSAEAPKKASATRTRPSNATSAHADRSRRRFLACFSSLGLSTTLVPGVLWARLQQDGARRVTPAMLRDALSMAGLAVSDEDQARMLPGINRSLDRAVALRAMHIDDEIAPPLYFSPIVPGTRLDRTARPFRPSAPGAIRRPANLEDVALWPI